MFRLLVILCICALPSAALASQLVAVLEFRGVALDDQVLLKLSDSVRVAARETLPKSDYVLMTRENMVQILRDNELDPNCIRGECEVETGRNIGAELIISGDVLKLSGQYLLTIKLYETASGNLLSAKEAEAESELALVREVGPITKSVLQDGLGVGKKSSFWSFLSGNSAQQGRGRAAESSPSRPAQDASEDAQTLSVEERPQGSNVKVASQSVVLSELPEAPQVTFTNQSPSVILVDPPIKAEESTSSLDVERFRNKWLVNPPHLSLNILTIQPGLLAASGMGISVLSMQGFGTAWAQDLLGDGLRFFPVPRITLFRALSSYESIQNGVVYEDPGNCAYCALGLPKKTGYISVLPLGVGYLLHNNRIFPSFSGWGVSVQPYADLDWLTISTTEPFSVTDERIWLRNLDLGVELSTTDWEAIFLPYALNSLTLVAGMQLGLQPGTELTPYIGLGVRALPSWFYPDFDSREP